MQKISIQVKRLEHATNLPLPEYATEDSAGLDLLAAIDEDIVLGAGCRTIVPTGLAFAIPSGYEAQIRPRSGLAFKHGVTVLNSPGTIDADYRGEVKIILVNLGQEEFKISRGMRIAQAIFAPVTQATWCEVDSLDETARGEGGFGSTGIETTEDRDNRKTDKVRESAA